MNIWSSARLGALQASPADARDRDATDASLPLRGLFEQHADFVYRSLRLLGVGEPQLDDALARVFLLAHQHLSDRDERPTRGWLYAACRHIAREGAFEVSPSRLEPPADPQHDALAFAERLLSLLPPPQREVFLLYEVEDLPVAEIACALERSERAVRNLLGESRARIVAEVERIAAAAYDE